MPSKERGASQMARSSSEGGPTAICQLVQLHIAGPLSLCKDYFSRRCAVRVCRVFSAATVPGGTRISAVGADLCASGMTF